MDCVLILFGRPLKSPIQIDPDSQQPEPSWDNSLKVHLIVSLRHRHFSLSVDE